MIFDPYTIIYPRTVVVKSLHTLMAYRAVPRPGCADAVTVRAEVGWLIHL
jgi:hypothetical protein